MILITWKFEFVASHTVTRDDPFCHTLTVFVNIELPMHAESVQET